MGATGTQPHLDCTLDMTSMISDDESKEKIE